MKQWMLLLLALTIVGCASKDTFEVEVTNKTYRPVTLWLNKVGPPAEEGWYTPEELVKMPVEDQHYDLAFVPPNKTGYTGELTGSFPEGTTAVLRVYEGEHELHALSVMPVTKRADFVLHPGMNELVIVERAGRMVVEPVEH